MNLSYDVAVVGAGTAGLQAALTLGRMHRRVVVLGTEHYRNDPAHHMHNFLGHDGEPPGALRAAARADVERYATVTFVDCGVTAIEEIAGGDGFRLELEGADGTGPVTARRVLLATGVVDDLPDVPGLVALFGGVVAHCPFCHGHEFTGTPVGILGSAPHVAGLVGMVAPIASRVVVLTDGEDLDEDTAVAVKRRGAEVRTDPVRSVRPSPLGLWVDLEGEEVELGGLFVKTIWRQATPFADLLGLEQSPQGAVLVDGMGRTSRAGVYAAGDLAQLPGLPMPMASVLTAASAGLIAAAACVQDEAM